MITYTFSLNAGNCANVLKIETQVRGNCTEFCVTFEADRTSSGFLRIFIRFVFHCASCVDTMKYTKLFVNAGLHAGTLAPPARSTHNSRQVE